MNLNVFLGNKPMPNYRLLAPKEGNIQTIVVHEEVIESLKFQEVLLNRQSRLRK